jgi:8-oxo-dGTP pyrophosphatase MutT (NUDIX family)
MNFVTTQHIARKVRRMFGGDPLRLQVAALPWRRSRQGIEVMLITSRDSGRWLLPKGWPEFGEEFCDAAAREAREEAGLKGTISSAMAGRYCYRKRMSGEEIRCEVMVYPLEVAGVAGKWKEKGERRRKWMSAPKAAGLVAEADLGKLILDFAANMKQAA